MKLYIQVKFYESYLKLITDLLEAINASNSSNEKLVEWVTDFTDLCSRLQALKSDVNDAKREESANNLTRKANILKLAGDNLASIRDELRKRVFRDIIDLSTEDTLRFFVARFMEVTSHTKDESLSYNVRDIVNTVLRRISSERSLDVSTNTFKQCDLLRMQKSLRSVWKHTLGHSEAELFVEEK
ncbi:p21 [Tobacco virus 1]|uniref:p21 n=1 Tax=Tobacco virus 1 TaxID=1692045 RepID=A0A0K1HRT6_9CLOS|nr:p21 [Tobacco virus 1]AKT94765.1 p21 [Tobacco virus 1]